MENELMEHNKKQIQEYWDYIENEIPMKPKDSSKLLEYKN